MIDQDFYKKDKEFYHEYLKTFFKNKDEIRNTWKELRRKALRLLNDDLHHQGHEGSIGGMDVSDDELWKYLKGEEKELFNKYARFLDFEMGFRPHRDNDDNQEGFVIRKSNRPTTFKVKRFKDIKESKLIKEGMRFNTTYFSLPEGEYNIDDVLKELEELKNELMVWKRGGWQTVSAPDRDNKEIIPLMK